MLGCMDITDEEKLCDKDETEPGAAEPCLMRSNLPLQGTVSVS